MRKALRWTFCLLLTGFSELEFVALQREGCTATRGLRLAALVRLVCAFSIRNVCSNRMRNFSYTPRAEIPREQKHSGIHAEFSPRPSQGRRLTGMIDVRSLRHSLSRYKCTVGARVRRCVKMNKRKY